MRHRRRAVDRRFGLYYRANLAPLLISAHGTDGKPSETAAERSSGHGSTAQLPPGDAEWQSLADGESFLRVHWVAVPKELRARRLNSAAHTGEGSLLPRVRRAARTRRDLA
eukprot:COSAG01_NODE_258_length_20077_cov_124.162429_5_plen_111_part_00